MHSFCEGNMTPHWVGAIRDKFCQWGHKIQIPEPGNLFNGREGMRGHFCVFLNQIGQGCFQNFGNNPN